MTKALDKLNVEKKNLYTTVLMSVSSAVIVILIFYFLFFYGQINCGVCGSAADDLPASPKIPDYGNCSGKCEGVSLYIAQKKRAGG